MLLLFVLGFPMLVGTTVAERGHADETVARAHEASSGSGSPEWAESCGFGRFYTGDPVSFSHEIAFTVPVDANSGYLVDCYTGTDAYLEYAYATDDGFYVYVVWGQLGDYQ